MIFTIRFISNYSSLCYERKRDQNVLDWPEIVFVNRILFLYVNFYSCLQCVHFSCDAQQHRFVQFLVYEYHIAL